MRNVFRKGLSVAFAALAFAAGGGAQAREFRAIYSNPAGSIVGLSLDESGTLYGSTYGGGNRGYGSVFSLDQSGNATTLYSFKSKSGPAFPSTRPWRDASGTIYGIASRINGDVDGTAVFKLSGGRDTMLTFFGEGTGALGAPHTGITADEAGNLYGATCTGGANGHGNVFRIGADGALSTLHDFTGSDGDCPRGDLVFDGRGNLVGTTSIGGAANGGTIFSIAPDGSYRVLHDFVPKTDGSQLLGGVTLDEHGNMYGTTSGFGPLSAGTIYRLSPHGAFRVMHVFGSVANDGSMAIGSLARDAKGNFYGVTLQGGPYVDSMGTFFRIRPNGGYSILHDFGNGEGMPGSAPVVDANGNVYVATLGVIYELGK